MTRPRISAEEAEEMRELARKGWSGYQIGHHLGLAQSTVHPHIAGINPKGTLRKPTPAPTPVVSDRDRARDRRLIAAVRTVDSKLLPEVAGRFSFRNAQALIEYARRAEARMQGAIL